MTMIPVEVSVLVAAGAVALFVVLNSVDSCYIFPADVPNPCRGVVCNPGAACRPTQDGRSYECYCPESCPSYGDHTGSRPFCGSDAKDYPGECEMRRAACHSGENITLKYYGKCDPCAGISCPDPEVCQLDAQRNPACRCAEPCSLEFSPVCASDGKTYSNECQMNRESCRARKQLKVVFKGQCSSGVNPCAEVQCRHGGECRVEVAGAKCACAASCEPVLRPVCGSDGRTHDSECELRRLACTLDKDLKVAHFGVCGSQGACVGRVCPHGGECVSAGGRGVCRCPRCSNEFAPVCGSDGISYGNRCKLQLEACRHKRDVHVIYDGPCNGCENKKCDYYAVCESDGVADAGCVCPKHCEEGTETEEVCGSDNRTYVSLCELRNTACKEKRHILIKHMGSCESCLGIQCQAGTWCSRGQCSCSVSCAGVKKEPVCSTTGRTFPHECALKKVACETKMRGDNNPVTVAFYGECSDRRPDNPVQANNKSGKVTLKNDMQPAPQEDSDSVVYQTVDNEADICSRVQCAYEATCASDSNGQPKCACQFDCAAATASATGPVCASDLRLYPTLCHMKLEACRRQEDLRLRPLPLCKGLEFKPCGDDEAILDASGRPMDCGGGPHRKDCPTGSYCHHTVKASRCCKKVPEAMDKGNDKKKGCEDSWHGCCPDGVTPARGAGGVGCPTQCGCHRLGSSNDGCDENGQCSCRPGVGGLKCDRCEPGYWGLPRIGMGHTGCIPCGCSAFGSVREDCEQMTGRCVCKPGIQGQKCTVCGNHEHALGPNGCYDPETTQLPATSCDHASCHFGAGCMIRSGLATCTCPPTDCPVDNSAPSVCGSDGKTYLSACHLKSHACQTQTDVVVQAFGHCSEEVPTVSRGSRASERRLHIARRVTHRHDVHHMFKRNASSGNTVEQNSIPKKIGPPKVESAVQTLKRVVNFASDVKNGDIDVSHMKENESSKPRKSINTNVENVDSPDNFNPISTSCPNTRPNYLASSKDKEMRIIDDHENNSHQNANNANEFYDNAFFYKNIEIEANAYHFKVPMFSSNSHLKVYMKLPHKSLNIYADLSLKCSDGEFLSVYGLKDHVWMGLVNSSVVLSWDAGSGSKIINTGRYELKNGLRRIRISVRRYKRDAILKVNGSVVRGTSPGQMKSLDLDPTLYIGQSPWNISKNLMHLRGQGGFTGCIHRLLIGSKSIIPPSPDLNLVVSHIKECSATNFADISCL